jgi:hypothetical protein
LIQRFQSILIITELICYINENFNEQTRTKKIITKTQTSIFLTN